jgi:predicted amidohydrolase YtcJ
MCIACGPFMEALLGAARAPSRRTFLKGSGALLSAGMATGLSCTAVAQQDGSDIVFRGGPILTMRDAAPRAEAVLVRDGRIVAVGDRAEIEKAARAGSRTVDLGGRTLLPGFFDPHGHVVMIGLQSLSANLLPAPDGQANDIPSIERLLRDWIARNDATVRRYGLVIGFGYDDSQLTEARHPTRDDLDRISADLPVAIIHQSGHLGVLNSKALEIAGISAATENPAGGVFQRKPGTREPNGVCEEEAFFRVVGILFSRFDQEAFLKMVEEGSKFCASFGYTTVQEARAVGPTTGMIATAGDRGLLDVDVLVYPDILASAADIKPSSAYRNRFRVGGGKLTIDGSPQGKTAYLTQPYFIPPAGRPADYVGYAAITKQQLDDAVDLAFARDWQVITHANGDAAVDWLIDAVGKATRKYPKKDRRAVLIHGQTTRLDQLPRLKEIDIVPSFFPMHTFYWGDWHRESVLGPERASRISPCNSARKLGMIFTSHHDAPVANPDSMRVLSATVTRLTRSGVVLGPDERVDVMTALKAMTIWAAYQHFEEASKGSIEVGKLADFAVLDSDPTAIPTTDLSKVKVVETYKEGRRIFSRA